MEEIREIIEGLIKEHWDSIKEEFKELKGGMVHFMFDGVVPKGHVDLENPSESDIQLIYEEIIPHVEIIKESLFKISVLEKIREKWKEITEEEELKKK